MLAATVVLSACASKPPDEMPVKFQNAVYRVGDQPTAMPAAKSGEATSAMQAPAKAEHIHWFFER